MVRSMLIYFVQSQGWCLIKVPPSSGKISGSFSVRRAADVSHGTSAHGGG